MKKYIFPAVFVFLFCFSCDSEDDEPNPEAVAEGPAGDETILNVVLGLERSQELLAERVEEIHDPDSPYYHDFRSISEIAEEFGADDSVIDSVREYLREQGISLETDITGGFLFGQATVRQLNRLFSTELYLYKLDKDTFIAPLTSPTLPSGLKGLVTEVLGLSTEPSLWEVPGSGSSEAESVDTKAVIETPGSPTVTGTREGCEDALKKKGFTPNQIRTAYGIDELHQQGYQGEGITMALVEGSRFDQSSIDAFTSCFGISDPVLPNVVQLGSGTLKRAGEPFLDIETILTIAPHLSGLYVFQTELESLADWVVLFASPLNPGNTGGVPVRILSASIGNCEIKWGHTPIHMLEYVFMSAAASGVHTFVSAGDSGSSTCYHHDKTTRTRSVEYPASSLYVTGVGGTNLALHNDNTIKGEGVWNDKEFPPPYNKKLGAGGGGKSKFLKRPSWQVGTHISGSMRTTPDVAFFADPNPGYVINESPKGWRDDGGTSAATPFFAASMALVLQAAEENDVTLDLTYIMIYRLANSDAYPVTFQDIVIGNNDLFDVGCCTAGPGYDMASGWGSLNIGSLLQDLLSQ